MSETTQMATQMPTQMHEFIDRLRVSPYIRERRFGDISSFNFTRQAFYSGHWDDVTTKARGLFINTRTEQIVARGYDKFFNVDENPQTTMDELRRKLVYPVEVYRKENGFLGLISWDHDKDDFFFATKSMIEGPYVDALKHIFFHSGINTNAVKAFLSKWNVTMVVEVIDPAFDPHIIEYSEAKLVLLDIIGNYLNPIYMIYPLLVQRALEFRMDFKKHERTVMAWEDVEYLKWYCSHPQSGFDVSGKPFEGYVLRDGMGYMVKLKTAYYLKWKKYRWQADRIIHGQPLPAPEPDAFLLWVEQHKDSLAGKSIIDMRNMYEQTHKA